MKKTTNELTNRKHLSIHKLRNSELKATKGGEIITCGMTGDLCDKLSVETKAFASHKVVLAECAE